MIKGSHQTIEARKMMSLHHREHRSPEEIKKFIISATGKKHKMSLEWRTKNLEAIHRNFLGRPRGTKGYTQDILARLSRDLNILTGREREDRHQKRN